MVDHDLDIKTHFEGILGLGRPGSKKAWGMKEHRQTRGRGVCPTGQVPKTARGPLKRITRATCSMTFFSHSL